MAIHNPNKLPTIDYRKVQPLQENLKDLHTEQHDQLMRILTNRGFKQPLNLWHKGDEFFLMDGHQRQRVMIKNDMNDNGNYEVPYFVTEAATKKEAVEQLLEITSQYGKTTPEGLDELASLYELELGELDIHFDAIDMDKFMDDLVEDDEADDEAPEVDEVNPPVSKLGEVYQLGAHRLMCGDSTSLEAVEQLMEGAKADMVFTDPPYGVSYQSNMRTKSAKFAIIENDNQLITEWIAPTLAVSKGFVFIWTTWKVLAEWLAITKPIGEMTNMIVWDKGGGGIGDLQGTYSTDHEIALVFNRGAKLTGKRLGSVWGFNKDGSSTYVHPTQKPVALGVQAMQTTTNRGDRVLDVFGGSGSTLIAAEKLGRICYMMELDPKYCDIIRKRYAKYIGQEEQWQEVTPIAVSASLRVG